MKYITIVAKDFESAVKKARAEYGQSIRIHSRRDTSYRRGLFGLKKIPSVELICYLVPSKETPILETEEDVNVIEEKEETIKKDIPEKDIVKEEEIPIETPEPSEPSISMYDTLISHAHDILKKNQFSSHCISIIEALLTESLTGNSTIPSKEEFELMVVDKIVSLITIDHESQLHPLTFLLY